MSKNIKQQAKFETTSAGNRRRKIIQQICNNASSGTEISAQLICKHHSVCHIERHTHSLSHTHTHRAGIQQELNHDKPITTALKIKDVINISKNHH